MTDLLTRDEYAAIAADLDLPAAPFIDGKFRAGSGVPMPTLNPATGETLTTIATAGAVTTARSSTGSSKATLRCQA